jgi:hypothetical protein
MCKDKGTKGKNNRQKESWLFGWMNKRRDRQQSPGFFDVCDVIAYFMNKNQQNQEKMLYKSVSSNSSEARL